MSTLFGTTPAVPSGLTDEEGAKFVELASQLQSKRSKNALLSSYYDGHRSFKSLGIAVPDNLRGIRAAMGWPEKAVQALAQKHVLEGFALDGSADPFDVNELLEQNRFERDLGQAISAAYKHAVSFLTVTHGDVTAGEPEVLIQARDAEWSTALWDTHRREITAFLAVTSLSDEGHISGFVLMLPGTTVVGSKAGESWQIDRRASIPGRVLAEPLVHDPQLGRPFGRSRITREVRYLTDAAIRTMVRAEVSSEFFAAPQRYAIGVDENGFDVGRWTATMGRLLALQTNEDGEMPQVGQFPQISMAPHLEHYRQLAQNFCAATGLPQAMVGIYADNPASAEAMQAAEARLAETAEYQWRVFKPALKRTIQNMIMLRDRLSEPPSESWKLAVNTRPARYVSPQAAADFTVKAVGAIPKIADTTEALRGLGYSDEQIKSMQSEWSRQGVSTRLEQILAERQQTDEVSQGVVPGE